MTDIQLLTIVLTLLAIFAGIYLNRKSVEDMRDVLRAEAKAQTTQMESNQRLLAADIRSEFTTYRSEITVLLLRIENKLDHLAETVASHSQKLDDKP